MFDLSWHAWYTLGVLALMIAALVREVARPDLVLLGCLGLLLVAGVVPPEAAFAGFSNPATLTIASLFVVAAGVQRTDALAVLDRLLFFEKARGLPLTLLRLMAPTALLSAFVNNTPLVAMLVPRLQSYAARTGVAPSKIMMPLSYAAVLGGMITIIGTSTNLVVSGLLLASTGRGLGFFDVTWAGLPAALAAIAYFAALGYRALPERRPASPFAGGAPADYHFEVRVGDASPLAGQTVEEAGLRALGHAYLTHLRRGPHIVGPLAPHEVLLPGDVLAFTGSDAALEELLERPGLEKAAPSLRVNSQRRLPLFEAVVSGSSSLVGKTLREADFRERFGGVVLAIQRQEEQITDALGRVPLRPGDLLLVEARPGFHERWSADRTEFYLAAPRRPGRPSARRRKAPLALGLFAVMVVVSALGVVPLVTASFVAALAMIATRCLRASETREAIDVPVLVMIAAALGIGQAIEAAGLAEAIAHAVVYASANLGPLGVLAILYVATNLMTELLTNSAAAALLVPVALAAAADLGVDPVPFAVAVAIAASAGFATPFGYQTNLMVMSAGGYRFMDFVRAGLPLNLIVAVVALAAIWIVWM